MICTLCPRQCRADRAVRAGFCGLGEEMRIARIAPHLWEEPPVSGTRGTGAVFFQAVRSAASIARTGKSPIPGRGKLSLPGSCPMLCGA